MPQPRRTVGGRDPLGGFAAAVAFLLPVAWLPGLASPSWAPKSAIALLVAAVGLPRLVLLARSPRPGAARAALGLLGVATASTLTSGDFTTSVFGLYQWGTGLLFIAAVTGAWAIGASLSPEGRRAVRRGLSAGCLLTAGVGVGQLLVPDLLYGLPTIEDRATGLTGNPVYFGGLVAAALALVVPRATGRALLAVALLAVAVQASGSRTALTMAILVVAVVAVRDGRRALPVVAALVVGLMMGGAIGSVGASGSQRLAEGVEAPSSGLTSRLEAWRSAPTAIADAPLLGAGPGRFRAATSRYRTLGMAQAEGSDRLFADAHNLAVEAVVTLGALGLLAHGAWLCLAVRRSGGPLAGFAIVLGVFALVEPQSVATGPVALLALGAAGPPVPSGSALPLIAKTFTCAIVTAALVLAVMLLVGERHLELAARDFDVAAARRADRLLPAWPEPAALIGWVGAATNETDALERTRTAYAAAAERDPTSSRTWNRLATLELKMGILDQARRHFAQALEHDPWSGQAMLGLARAALSDGHEAEAERWLLRVLQIGSHPWAEEQLRTMGKAG